MGTWRKLATESTKSSDEMCLAVENLSMDMEVAMLAWELEVEFLCVHSRTEEDTLRSCSRGLLDTSWGVGRWGCGEYLT